MIRFGLPLVFCLGSAVSLCAQTPPAAAMSPGEARVARAMEAAKKLGPPALYALLQPMPKGADLHMHLSGAVYAETFIAEAVREGLCVDPVALKLTQPAAGKESACAAGNVPAAAALKDQHLYDALIDAFSMRSFVPHAGVSGHDQFFDTFDRFGGLKNDAGEWLDEVATRAARQNEQYLEIMQTPPFSHAASLGYKLGWPAGAEQEVTPKQLQDLRSALLALGLKDEVAADSKVLADAKRSRNTLEHCAETVALPACDIRIHWLYQVLRAFPPQQVFAQTLLGFEVANANPDVVGINFVQPEDARLAMGDYHLQMEMLDYLHSVYPNVRISLHAGELAPGLVPPAGMRFHIREAVELGHAQRIGHGVDVLYEDRPEELLQEMAARHVMVEINLTSNEGILGVKGHDHPLAEYRAAHVPVALSTDDEGVSRIDLTHEYVKAVEEQGLTYVDLKQMARTSLEHAFLAGDSLWQTPDVFTRKVAACARPSDTCSAFLKANEKAAMEFELERRLAVFEAR